MIGPNYWSTGITLRWRQDRDGNDTWAAIAKFLDSGFCSDDADHGYISTEGELRTRYFVHDGHRTDALTAAIDAVIGDAGRLGIQWRDPMLYMEGDGEDPEWPPPPGWQDLLREHAKQVGWEACC